MALGTYTELVEAVARWLNREDLAGLSGIRQSGRKPDKRPPARFADGNDLPSLPLRRLGCAPARFHRGWRFYCNREGGYTTALTPLSPSQAGDAYPVGAARCPVHYTIVGDTLATFPNGGDSQVTMTYYAKVPPLAADGTNWLLSRNPNVYLYGTLLEVGPLPGG